MDIKVLSNQSNSVVVDTPERHYPGVILQGDSISNLFERVREIYDYFSTEQHNEDLKYSALEVAEVLQSHLLHYEAALQKNGIDLPYCPSVEERLGLENEGELEETNLE